MISKLKTKTDDIVGLPYGTLVEWNKQAGIFERVEEVELDDDDFTAGKAVESYVTHMMYRVYARTFSRVDDIIRRDVRVYLHGISSKISNGDLNLPHIAC